MKYKIVSGQLLLASGQTLTGVIDTADKKLGLTAESVEELKRLAEVRTGLGRRAYVQPLAEAKAEGSVDDGQDGGQSAPTDPPPADAPPALTYTLPEGVNEQTARQVEGYLKEAGHTFESANLLSDEDLDKLDNIAAGRIRTIRLVGTANSYPAFTPAPQE